MHGLQLFLAQVRRPVAALAREAEERRACALRRRAKVEPQWRFQLEVQALCDGWRGLQREQPLPAGPRAETAEVAACFALPAASALRSEEHLPAALEWDGSLLWAHRGSPLRQSGWAKDCPASPPANLAER